MLWNYSGKPSGSGSFPSNYVDFPTASDEYKAVRWAYRSGLITGTTYTSLLQRKHYALILYRFAGSPTYTSDVGLYFDDCGELNSGFKKAIAWVGGKQYMNGTSSRIFSPNGTITRITDLVVLKKYATFAP